MLLHKLNSVITLSLISFSLQAAGSPVFLGTDEGGEPAVYYQGQAAENSTLVLDANNGFFDKGSFKAIGKKPVDDPAEKALISSHFEGLKTQQSPSSGAARWYFWGAKAGAVKAKVQFDLGDILVSDEKWELRIGDEVQIIQLPKKTGKVSLDCEFNSQQGLQTLEMRKLSSGAASSTVLLGLELKGAATEDAKLVRARWRPAAVHARYSSSTCAKTKMWVFETRNDYPNSNYSPVTTSFGYFGATFDKDQRASGGINFSMWAASNHAETVPELAKMPHLIATGNADAEFSGFGHEGSGVKVRNWEPFSHHPKSVIQALRVETHDGMDTFFGYIYDEPTANWKLYASAMRPQKKKTVGDTTLQIGSFCEVPGPPQAERTGDQRRQVARRGWFYGEDKQWHGIDAIHLGVRGDDATSKSVGVSTDGWLTMATGGVAMSRPVKTVKLKKKHALPQYLAPEKSKGLLQLPVEFLGDSVEAVTSDSAKVIYDLAGLGEDAVGVLYFGPVDCLSFVERKLHGTEKKGVSKDFLSKDRTWREQLTVQPLQAGKNTFSLKNLESQSKYFYRLFVRHADGKSWAYRSGQFTTK